jgi:hypothetical protein
MGRQEIGDLKNIIYNMKTALTLAFQRIELMKDLQTDSIHWEMFKRNYLEMEKENIKRAYEFGTGDAYNSIEEEAEAYYNETYTDDNN